MTEEERKVSVAVSVLKGSAGVPVQNWNDCQSFWLLGASRFCYRFWFWFWFSFWFSFWASLRVVWSSRVLLVAAAKKYLTQVKCQVMIFPRHRRNVHPECGKKMMVVGGSSSFCSSVRAVTE